MVGIYIAQYTSCLLYLHAYFARTYFTHLHLILIRIHRYFDNTLQQEYGTRKHPLFFLFPSFWAPCLFKNKTPPTIGSGAAAGEVPGTLNNQPAGIRNNQQAETRNGTDFAIPMYDMSGFQQLSDVEQVDARVKLVGLYKVRTMYITRILLTIYSVLTVFTYTHYDILYPPKYFKYYLIYSHTHIHYTMYILCY